ncbi:hypothetical protein [Mycobacteroides salmoniphilum]|uniref:hypothetical protein n=1 Tax=Mycobacteroides salmoniphilum TaxID=404941 RepID=UPI00106639F2|nr:hypothetical protein [Mycobacteroides salmoniphilum]
MRSGVVDASMRAVDSPPPRRFVKVICYLILTTVTAGMYFSGLLVCHGSRRETYCLQRAFPETDLDRSIPGSDSAAYLIAALMGLKALFCHVRVGGLP